MSERPDEPLVPGDPGDPEPPSEPRRAPDQEPDRPRDPGAPAPAPASPPPPDPPAGQGGSGEAARASGDDAGLGDAGRSPGDGSTAGEDAGPAGAGDPDAAADDMTTSGDDRGLDAAPAGEDRYASMRRSEAQERVQPLEIKTRSGSRPTVEADSGSPSDDADLERPGGLLSQIDHHVVLYHDAHGLQAEQYRQCRTNLTALNRSGAPFVVVVTSSRKGEGKSVSAANLAVCLAEQPGARVCLVDADTRAPRQERCFGVRGTPGLSQLLAGRAALEDVLLPTLIPGLQLLPAGGEVSNPAEALGGPRWADLMSELRRRFSWIVVDTPPVHPFTDACVAARSANGVLVVVRLLETPRHLVNSTVEAVRNAGGKVMGTFLTGLTPDRDDEEDVSFYPADMGADTPDGIREARRARRKEEKAQRRKERSILKQQGKAERDDDPFPV